MLDEKYFCSSFVREYLRYIQRDKSTLTGVFEYEPGEKIVWGAIAEYGAPPVEGLIIEMWSIENDPEDSASFRFWYGRDNKGGKTMKGRVIQRDELTTRAPVNA